MEAGRSHVLARTYYPPLMRLEQIADAVHAKGSYIYMQIWALGRAATPAQLREENPDFPYVSASDLPLSDRTDGEKPRPLTMPGECPRE